MLLFISQKGGGVWPAVAGFSEPIFAHFTQGSFAPGFKISSPEGGGDGLEVEFRIFGGGFQRFEKDGDGLEVSKWLARLSSLREEGGHRMGLVQPENARNGPSNEVWSLPDEGCPESRRHTDLFCRF